MRIPHHDPVPCKRSNGALSTSSPPPEALAKFDMRPLDAKTVPLVAEWLADPLNHKWLDFGLGRQTLGEAALKVMQKSDAHFIRVIHEEGGRPVGIFGLHHLDHPFGNAMLWGVRPRLRPPTPVRTKNVLMAVLEHAFETHGLHSVHAWVVDRNHASASLMRSIGMQEMGRMRKCHLLDGVPHDRLLFDITREDFDAHVAAAVDGGVTGDEK